MVQPNIAQLQNQFNQSQFPLAGSGPIQVRDHLEIIFLRSSSLEMCFYERFLRKL